MARAHNGSLLDFDTDTIKYNVSMKTCHLCLSEFFAQSDLLEHIDNDHDLRHPFKRGKSVDSMNISKIVALYQMIGILKEGLHDKNELMLWRVNILENPENSEN